MPQPLDVVRLDVSVSGWPVGTEATVLEVYESSALIEVDDDEGTTLDMPVAPFSAITVVWEADREYVV